jgi:hypothetical protein
MRKDELTEKIKLSIEDSSVPLWFPNLSMNLADAGWQRLKDELGLISPNYGTARILSGRLDAPLSGISLNGEATLTLSELKCCRKS